MPANLPRLRPDLNDRVAFQDTTFTHDVFGRLVCNTWDEVETSRNNGAYPFDAVIIGAGMFGGYLAAKLYSLGSAQALRILVLDAGALLFSEHIQNLPQRLGQPVSGPMYARQRDDGSGTQNVVWGMPWISNEFFPGLAYCLGGRSLFWGGWAPRMTAADLAPWPAAIQAYLDVNTNAGAFRAVEEEMGVWPTTDYIQSTAFHKKIRSDVKAARPAIADLDAVEEAPLAVQGQPPASGLFSYDKFSSAPFLIDAIREDVSANFSHGDVSRRLLLVPRAHVTGLRLEGNAVRFIDLRVEGQPRTLPVEPTCAVVLANGTIEATRLALDSLGVGAAQYGSRRVGNLVAHLRSNIVVRIKRAALGLGAPPTSLELSALLVRGSALGRRFHFQVTAAPVTGTDSEANMWQMVPDVEDLADIRRNQDPDWVVLTLRGIGETEGHRSLAPDPARSWIDLSGETDRWGKRRAYVHLALTPADQDLWNRMDEAAFALALELAGNAADIEYWVKPPDRAGWWSGDRPQPPEDPQVRPFWRDVLGSTHHEAGTLFMGQSSADSITDTEGKFHGVANAYVAGPALFPTLGSANPSLPATALARRTAATIVQRAGPSAPTDFAPLSLAPTDWMMVRQPNTPANMRHHGQVLETVGAYGLYWYTREQFDNFILHLEWRIGRREDNSGVYLRVPAWTVADPLQQADATGYEVQIDERGHDTQSGTDGHSLKYTGAIYGLQAPDVVPANQVGTWHTFRIQADGPRIRVALDGQEINDFMGNRRPAGYIALQAHDFPSRVQFRNLQVKRLP